MDLGRGFGCGKLGRFCLILTLVITLSGDYLGMFQSCKVTIFLTTMGNGNWGPISLT